MLTILATVIIIIMTIIVAVIKTSKEENNICSFNCKNCGEKDVCEIRKNKEE
ncbi:hypothetical protein [Clostridium niameyense]|uniref:hypothetical protein n=1 Tax=Clostridium niameyense TaxID=1622073 RepID=UPI000B1F3195|nr:hypothetical protein [Clostridium niameyense]